MAILKTAQLGNPILRQTAKPVPREEIPTPAFQHFIDDMIETMREYDGVGLAAPQVHDSRQVAVVECHDNRRYPDQPEITLTVLINPTVLAASKETQEDWEGCLSVEGLRGRVPRSQQIRVWAQDRTGAEHVIEAKDFFAVVLQHEIDHLNGRVFLDRMKDLTTLTHLREFVRYWIRPESSPPDPPAAAE